VQSSTRRLLGRRLHRVFAPLKRSIVLNEMKWCAVDLLSAALAWLLVAVYVWQARQRGEALLMGSLFMIYQYAQHFISFSTIERLSGANTLCSRRPSRRRVLDCTRRLSTVETLPRKSSRPAA